MISVILPTYNRQRTIGRAIRSVLSQTYQDVELIVVDDCSTDNTETVVESIDDKRLRLIRLSKNSGANKARNIGIKEAKGNYIAFQDSDDEWELDKLEEQLKVLEESVADYCFCKFTKISDDNEVIFPANSFMMPNSKEKMWRLLFGGNLISTQTLLVRKNVFDDIKFDEQLPRFQDWDFAIRMAKQFEGAFVDKPLVNIFEQNDSISKNNGKAITAFRLMEEKYKSFFENDKLLEYSFKKAECKTLWRIGENPTKKAKEVLKIKFDLKIFAILVLSIFGLKRGGR